MAGENGNGKSLFTFVGSVIAGVLGVVIVLYNMGYAPLSHAIANEAACRVASDNANCQTFNDGLNRLADKVDKYHDEAAKANAEATKANTVSVAALARIEERLGIKN